MNSLPPEIQLALAQRFWANVEIREGGCWSWRTSAKTHGGYVIVPVQRNGRRWQLKAHRVSFELFERDLLPGECVLHRCDNPECSNPDHLFTGSKADNNRDMRMKGRAALGERLKHSLFSQERVLELRRMYAQRWSPKAKDGVLKQLWLEQEPSSSRVSFAKAVLGYTYRYLPRWQDLREEQP